MPNYGSAVGFNCETCCKNDDCPDRPEDSFKVIKGTLTLGKICWMHHIPKSMLDRMNEKKRRRSRKKKAKSD
jgi:hypothetical protein